MLIKMINENDILTLTHTHRTHRTRTAHMARTHIKLSFSIQIQNNHKLLLPIHTVKIYMQHAHTLHRIQSHAIHRERKSERCVNKIYFKCLDFLACMRIYISTFYIFKIILLTALFQWQLINCTEGFGILVGWLAMDSPFFMDLFSFQFCEVVCMCVWPHKFVKRSEKHISFLSQLFIFAAEWIVIKSNLKHSNHSFSFIHATTTTSVVVFVVYTKLHSFRQTFWTFRLANPESKKTDAPHRKLLPLPLQMDAKINSMGMFIFIHQTKWIGINVMSATIMKVILLKAKPSQTKAKTQRERCWLACGKGKKAECHQRINVSYTQYVGGWMVVVMVYSIWPPADLLSVSFLVGFWKHTFLSVLFPVARKIANANSEWK